MKIHKAALALSCLGIILSVPGSAADGQVLAGDPNTVEDARKFVEK